MLLSALRLRVEGLAVLAGEQGRDAFRGLASRQEAEHDHGRGGSERRRDEQPVSHCLGEGVTGRGEQAGAGVTWKLRGDRAGCAYRVLGAGLRAGGQTDEGAVYVVGVEGADERA